MLPVILAAVFAVGVIFIAVIFGTAIGAFTGWILSLTFLGDWIISGFRVFGFDAHDKLVVVGAMFGFISGFIKTTVNNKGD